MCLSVVLTAASASVRSPGRCSPSDSSQRCDAVFQAPHSFIRRNVSGPTGLLAYTSKLLDNLKTNYCF